MAIDYVEIRILLKSNKIKMDHLETKGSNFYYNQDSVETQILKYAKLHYMYALGYTN